MVLDFGWQRRGRWISGELRWKRGDSFQAKSKSENERWQGPPNPRRGKACPGFSKLKKWGKKVLT